MISPATKSMIPSKTRFRSASPRGWTLVETLVTAAIIAVLAGVTYPVYNAVRRNALKVDSTQRMEGLATAFVNYTSDNNGNMPREDAVGGNDWVMASKPENADVWYNALPELMGAQAVGALASTPEIFYLKDYPLYFKAAEYPEDDKKLAKPYFAVAMNSRLQRRADTGEKKPGTMADLQAPSRTVMFFERGLPGEEKSMGALGGYDGTPKGNAKNFVARYNQKGLVIFADGHAELHPASDLISTSGMIPVPQTEFVWTKDPQEDPN